MPRAGVDHTHFHPSPSAEGRLNSSHQSSYTLEGDVRAGSQGFPGHGGCGDVISSFRLPERRTGRAASGKGESLAWVPRSDSSPSSGIEAWPPWRWLSSSPSSPRHVGAPVLLRGDPRCTQASHICPHLRTSLPLRVCKALKDGLVSRRLCGQAAGDTRSCVLILVVTWLRRPGAGESGGTGEGAEPAPPIRGAFPKQRAASRCAWVACCQGARAPRSQGRGRTMGTYPLPSSEQRLYPMVQLCQVPC